MARTGRECCRVTSGSSGRRRSRRPAGSTGAAIARNRPQDAHRLEHDPSSRRELDLSKVRHSVEGNGRPPWIGTRAGGSGAPCRNAVHHARSVRLTRNPPTLGAECSGALSGSARRCIRRRVELVVSSSPASPDRPRSSHRVRSKSVTSRLDEGSAELHGGALPSAGGPKSSRRSSTSCRQVDDATLRTRRRERPRRRTGSAPLMRSDRASSGLGDARRLRVGLVEHDVEVGGWRTSPRPLQPAAAG